jgi:hypothetical protein
MMKFNITYQIYYILKLNILLMFNALLINVSYL